MTKEHDQTPKPSSLVQKSRLERYWELVTRIKGGPVFKYGNLSTIVKCRFYGLKRLFLTKQHTEAKKRRSLEQKSRPEKYLELMTIIKGYSLFKICLFFNSKISFAGAKKPPFEKISSPNYKTIPLLQKSRLERYLELLIRIMGEPVLKYANFSTIVKCRFYGLKSLLLTKQHDQTTKPRSLVQKCRVERYLELMTRIMR